MDLFFFVFIEADNETRTETGQLEASAFNSRLYVLFGVRCSWRKICDFELCSEPFHIRKELRLIPEGQGSVFSSGIAMLTDVFI